MVMAAPFVGVLVDSHSGLSLGRPRLLVVPVGAVRLPAGVQLVAGAMAVPGDYTSRGRAGSVRAAAAGNGVSSVVLPVYASSDAGTFFRSTASSVALAAAAGRAAQSHGGVVVDDKDATPEAKEGSIIQYPDWLLLQREDGISKKEGIDMFIKEHILQLIRDFYPEDAVNETFLVCKDKTLLEFIGKELISSAGLLEECMLFYPPGPLNYEALATIGKELKLAATECQRGYLQADSLDRAVVAIKRLRATSLQMPEDLLERYQLEIRVRFPQRPPPELALDEQATRNYFMLMGAYLHL